MRKSFGGKNHHSKGHSYDRDYYSDVGSLSAISYAGLHSAGSHYGGYSGGYSGVVTVLMRVVIVIFMEAVVVLTGAAALTAAVAGWE